MESGLDWEEQEEQTSHRLPILLESEEQDLDLIRGVAVSEEIVPDQVYETCSEIWTVVEEADLVGVVVMAFLVPISMTMNHASGMKMVCLLLLQMLLFVKLEAVNHVLILPTQMMVPQ